jgi:AcrR family transcriptional regulator
MNEKAIAQRSKESINRALFVLMERGAYAEITVSEIAAQANLDRRTFYRHFKKKDDIISHYLKTAAKEYERTFSIDLTPSNYAIAEAFFASCYAQKAELALLLKQNLAHLLLAEMSVIFSAYQKKFASREELEHINREYMLAYHIGGFWNILCQWLADGCQKSPAEMAAVIEEIMKVGQI